MNKFFVSTFQGFIRLSVLLDFQTENEIKTRTNIYETVKFFDSLKAAKRYARKLAVNDCCRNIEYIDRWSEEKYKKIVAVKKN